MKEALKFSSERFKILSAPLKKKYDWPEDSPHWGGGRGAGRGEGGVGAGRGEGEGGGEGLECS